MEFIENNYVWLIVIGVIVIMTIIGYFADKMETNEAKPKKKKEKKNQIMDPVPEIEEEKVEVVLPPEWDENNDNVSEEQDIINIEGTGDTADWNVLPEIESEQFEQETNFDVGNEMVEPVEVETNPFEENITFENPISEDNVQYDFNDDLSQNDNEANLENENTNSDIENVDEGPIPEPIDELNELEITLPNIEELNEDENDEDVWKF